MWVGITIRKNVVDTPLQMAVVVPQVAKMAIFCRFRCPLGAFRAFVGPPGMRGGGWCVSSRPVVRVGITITKTVVNTPLQMAVLVPLVAQKGDFWTFSYPLGTFRAFFGPPGMR